MRFKTYPVAAQKAAGRVFRFLRDFKRLGGTSYHSEHESPAKSENTKKICNNNVVIKSMCNNFPNIRITEGNNFSIILPLLSRTYVATRPIDEEIDPEQLQNVVVTFGGVSYTVQLTERGVQIDLPATLAVGTYNILLTAEYLGSKIRAAYESAVTIVPWSEQSTAEQYIAGSPIVLRAAYVLSGALTDAELEALKEEYREKNAQLDQAIADAEAAKREWEEKAADLEGVAKQGENPNATNTAILEAVQQGGGTDIAKESTSQEILALLEAKTIPFTLGDCEFVNTVNVQDCAGALININNCTKLVSDIIGTAPQVRRGWDNIKEVNFRAADTIAGATNTTFGIPSSCEIYEAENAVSLNGYATFAHYTNLRKLNIKSLYVSVTDYNIFMSVDNLIDLIIGENLHLASTTFLNRFFNTWSPTNAMSANSQGLLTAEDIAAGFTSNLQEFLYNLREHFAANLADLTGQASKSITFSAAVKAAILADQPTSDAFTNKNWIIA